MQKIKFRPVSEQAKLFPPMPVKMALPSWYKNMSSNVDGLERSAINFNRVNTRTSFTSKRCLPMADYMVSGYSLRIQNDVMVSTFMEDNGIMSFQYRVPVADKNEVIGSHSYEQMPILIEGAKRHYIKLYFGWTVETPPGYSCLIYPSFYEFEDRFKLFPAIIDTDKFDSMFGCIGYFCGTDHRDFTIEAGTHVLNIFPFKREEWKMEIDSEIFDESKKSKLKNVMGSMFENAYRKFFHSKKSYD